MSKVKVYEFQNQEERDEGILEKGLHIGTAANEKELTAIISSRDPNSFLAYFTASNKRLQNLLIAEAHLIRITGFI